MLTDKERNEIDPEFCCRHLLGISSRLTNELRRDEHAAIFGAVSLIKDQSVDEWCFGIKQRRNGTTDKEKVINALERCESYGYCKDTDCPYYENTHCLELLRKDALILLKEQEPRLINLYDFDNADCWGNIPAWCEYNPSYGIKSIDSWLLITIDHLHDKTARYWTQRPTEDQRKAVKWDD